MSDITMISCCVAKCGHSPFPMHRQQEHKLRRTHETFYCPSGHAQHFASETKEEREIKQLRDRMGSLQRRINSLEMRLEEVESTCPWVGCGFVANSPNGLGTHMRAMHGMPTLAQVRDTA